jgi:hypothetical protein
MEMDSKWFDLYKRKIICHHTEDLSWCEYKTNYRPYSFIGSGNKSILPGTRLSQVLKLLCIDHYTYFCDIYFYTPIVYIETPVWEASYPFSLIWEASLLLMTCEHKIYLGNSSGIKSCMPDIYFPSYTVSLHNHQFLWKEKNKLTMWLNYPFFHFSRLVFFL